MQVTYLVALALLRERVLAECRWSGALHQSSGRSSWFDPALANHRAGTLVMTTGPCANALVGWASTSHPLLYRETPAPCVFFARLASAPSLVQLVK